MINDKSFMYDDFDFGELVPIIKTERPIYPERENKLAESDTYNGAKYVGYKYKSIIIPMRIGLRIDDVPEFKRELSSLLHKEEPKKLIFGNEQNKYYNAVIDGQTEYQEEGQMCHAMIYWLVPDGFAHAITDSNHTFDDLNAEPVTIQSDFAGKVAGSLVECPHVFGSLSSKTMPDPSGFISEANQGAYNSMSKLDGITSDLTTKYNGRSAYGLTSYNILEEVKRAYPFLFEGLGESEQVEKLRGLVVSVIANVWAKGSGPQGNSVSFRRWVWSTQSYGGPTTNTTKNIRQISINMSTQALVNQTLGNDGVMPFIIHADPSDGTTASSVSLDYTNVEITIKLPSGNIVTIKNNGTYPTPVDIYAKFATNAESIGFVSPENIVQLGNTETSDVPQQPLSEIILVDKMQPSSKSRWQLNVAQPRWRRDDPEYMSRVVGDVTWMSDVVRATDFGKKVPSGNKWYWKGPSLSWFPGQDIDNPEPKTWIVFEPTGKGKKRLEQKGLFEINVYDQDNNAVMGFEMKDNSNISNEITYSFFVGTYEIFKASLPKKYWSQGFVGMLEMQKKGNQFYFRLVRTRTNKKGINIEEWSSKPMTFTNESVAGLKGHRFDYWMSTWGNAPAVLMQIGHVQVRKYNTVDTAYIARSFVEGDELFVDGSTNYVYVNGQRFDDMRVLGSDQLFKVMPGQTAVEVVTDGELEELNLGLRERFL